MDKYTETLNDAIITARQLVINNMTRYEKGVWNREHACLDESGVKYAQLCAEADREFGQFN